MSSPVLVRVHALDPISEAGILAQLRECPGIRVAGAGDGAAPAVALAVIDLVDDDATSWLRSLHRRDGLPLVLVAGQLDSRALQDLTTRLYLRNRAHAVAHAVRNGWI
jgi:hypothetical protein